MSSLIRKTVSKKKRRYQKNGFDLDLSYITDNLIAMGFPSESMEGVYRNPLKEVFRFLEQMHKDRYKVYNLCSERGYDISKFHNRVESFPFDDHNCPPLELILKFCKNVKDWLSVHEKNVAVIHCKAGKGRTGLMICSYMLYSREWKHPQDALDFYAAMRTYNKKGVTIPSQIRYVSYFNDVCNKNNTLPDTKPLLLTAIELSPPPKISNLTDIRFSVYVNKTQLFTFKETPVIKNPQPKKGKKDGTDENQPQEALVFECKLPVPCVGDIKIEFYEKETFGSDRLFAFWFNTGFVGENNVLEIKKEGLDKANKDKNHKVYKENYRVSCIFAPLEADAKQLISNQTSQTACKPDADVLNAAKTFNSATKRSACEVAEDLLLQALEVCMNDYQRVLSTTEHYQAVRDSNAFKAFAISTCELQEVHVNELSHEERLSFWINTYNLLALHSNILFAPDRSSSENRVQIAKKAKYNVGGQVYSLLEIEACILRAKTTVPEEYGIKGFESSDQRSSSALSKPEPRVNFALCAGAVSSPLVRVFHTETVFEELERAARLYMKARVKVDAEKNEIRLPKMLEWYARDFGKIPEKVFKPLINYLPADLKQSVRKDSSVTFEDFDWNLYYSFEHFEKGAEEEQ